MDGVNNFNYGVRKSAFCIIKDNIKGHQYLVRQQRVFGKKYLMSENC